MTFTFKKQPKETGLASVGRPYQDVDIKLNKQVVGWIGAPNWKVSNWRIFFTVKSDDKCGWRNAKLRYEFDTEDEARRFLNENFEVIASKFEFHVLK